MLALRDRQERQLVIAALVFGLTYPANVAARFLIPPLPFLALAMGAAIAEIKRSYSVPGCWLLPEDLPIRPALRLISEASYPDERIAYAVAKMVNERVLPGQPIFTFSNPPEAYIERDVLVGFQSGDPRGANRDAPIPPMERDRVEIIRRDQGSAAHRELALGSAPQPVVQLAFDNSPVTVWRTWQPLFNGMFVEVDLGDLERMDSVLLECPPAPDKFALNVEGQNESGEWKLLTDRPEPTLVTPPRQMRRMVTEELKSRGLADLPAERTERRPAIPAGLIPDSHTTRRRR